MMICANSLSRGASSLDRSCDNATKFAVFRDNRDNVFGRKQRTLSNDLEPNCRLVQFFEYDFELVNEMGRAVRGSCLSIVSCSSGTGWQNLTANVPALRRLGQFWKISLRLPQRRRCTTGSVDELGQWVV